MTAQALETPGGWDEFPWQAVSKMALVTTAISVSNSDFLWVKGVTVLLFKQQWKGYLCAIWLKLEQLNSVFISFTKLDHPGYDDKQTLTKYCLIC